MQTNICMDIQITTDDTCPPPQGMQEPRKHERFLGFEMPPYKFTKAGERGVGAGGQNTRGPECSEGPGITVKCSYRLSLLYVCPK
jgi:hypothetical protein